MLCRSESWQIVIKDVVLMMTSITDLTNLNRRALFPGMALNRNIFKNLLKLRIVSVVRINNTCAKSVWPLSSCCGAGVTFLKGVKCP